MEPVLLSYEDFVKIPSEIQNKNIKDKEPLEVYDKKSDDYLLDNGWIYDECYGCYLYEDKSNYFWYSLNRSYKYSNHKRSLQWNLKKFKGDLANANPIKDRKISNDWYISVKEIKKVL